MLQLVQFTVSVLCILAVGLAIGKPLRNIITGQWYLANFQLSVIFIVFMLVIFILKIICFGI